MTTEHLDVARALAAAPQNPLAPSSLALSRALLRVVEYQAGYIGGLKERVTTLETQVHDLRTAVSVLTGHGLP